VSAYLMNILLVVVANISRYLSKLLLRVFKEVRGEFTGFLGYCKVKQTVGKVLRRGCCERNV